MATSKRKYKGSFSLGQLELALDTDEQAFGELQKLEALGGWTVATYDDADFPPLNSLAVLPAAAGLPTPAPEQATPLFDGHATIMGAAMPVALFRTS